MVSEDILRESVGTSIVNLIHGVRDMAAIRQLKATHTDSVSSEQVDNVRRMLLAMVDDFRCVVIKLAERIAHLREVKDAPEDERVLAAKECTNIYAPLANRLGIGQLKWELEDYCFRYLHPAEYKRIAKPVSYTHLDVYKRQSLSGPCLPCCRASSISLAASALSLRCLPCASWWG